MPRDVDSQPSPSQPDESPASSAGSSTSSSEPFVGDRGPGFDARTAGEPPLADDALEPGAALFADVTEDQVQDVLRNVGDGVHALFGVGDYDWVMTQTDLERIGGPLTRIVNRYEPLRAIGGHSDELAVAVGFGLYGWRSALERRAVLASQKRDDRGPAPAAAGAPPAPANGTPPDVPDELATLAVEEGYVPQALRHRPAPEPES